MAGLTYFAAQIQLAPYHELQDNYVANACSFSLTVTFICCTLLKFAMLLQEEAPTYQVDVGALGAILFVSVVTSFVLSVVIFIADLRWERKRRREEMLAKTAKRLRYRKSNELVELPTIPADWWHLFLSHVWGESVEEHTSRVHASPSVDRRCF